IDQLATNKFKGGINPGARLHDDFNGENKDIYVENFTSPEDGAQVFARIKLKEYMEIGPTAGSTLGDKEAETSPSLTIVGKEDANINDFSTWHTHSFEPNSEAELAFRNYWSWTMGNAEGEELYYMPTFNKDNESLDADINGSLEGTGDKVVDTTTGDVGKGDGTPYNDYTEWKTGVNKKGIEILNRGEEGEEVTHTTKKIDYNATVMSMEQWVAQGKKVGPYWVYDKDGWAYWAQAINPGETTGLLLNRVEKNQMPSDNYYYGIHVIGQFATAGDWSGFEDDITSQGEELLNVVANRMPQVVYMTPSNGVQQYAVVGSDLQLQVNVNVQNAPSDEAEAVAFIEKAKKAVQWTINDENFSNTVHENIFTPTEEMVGKTYILTARSKITPSVTTSLTVRILPLGVDGNEVIVGEDGENYISFGYNVYKRLEADGSLSKFICAGRDEKIGNSDDQLNVYDMINEVGKADVTYGRFYIKKADNRYYAMGEDEKLGTADDIVVCSATNKWPENISNKVADRVVVKTANGETTDVQVKIGQTTQFIAEVYLANQLSSNQKVKWTIEGNKSSDTKISEDGLLIIGIDEPVDNYIRVFAAAEDAEAYAKNSLLVRTSSLGYEDIPT
ncbi:MAG: hypothetical protein K2L08_06525, partial [Erysipelotrichaceae bacterium]|nr:hypothetical protein [Erysipelotrichaceae bacterium]